VPKPIEARAEPTDCVISFVLGGSALREAPPLFDPLLRAHHNAARGSGAASIGWNNRISYPRDSDVFERDNGGRKGKRPNIGPAVWRHQNRDALNEAHVPFDFFELLLPFFFVAMALLLEV
jgi:hypothetical protein